MAILYTSSSAFTPSLHVRNTFFVLRTLIEVWITFLVKCFVTRVATASLYKIWTCYLFWRNIHCSHVQNNQLFSDRINIATLRNVTNHACCPSIPLIKRMAARAARPAQMWIKIWFFPKQEILGPSSSRHLFKGQATTIVTVKLVLALFVLQNLNIVGRILHLVVGWKNSIILHKWWVCK